MKKHFYSIKNKAAYFKKAIKNMDLYDIVKEQKHKDFDVQYNEFLDNESHKVFNIKSESKYKGMLHWIDLIQNDKLYDAIECLSYDEKYLISLLFYEDKTQQELAKIYKTSQISICNKINKIILKIKNIYSKGRI